MPDTQAATVVNKVAKITLLFWILKICATTLGETAGDLVSMTLKVGYGWSCVILLSLFFVALAAQLASRRFHAWLYWTVILASSTAGTTLSDFMDRTLGLGYARGSLILAVGLFTVLAAWRYREKSLSVATIQSRRVEAFYWTAILVSNTLGTALGDYLADDSGLGFLGGAMLIGACIGWVALAYRYSRISHVLLFWTAFVLTRPFGATFGDLLTKPVPAGGFDLGTIGASAVLAAILVLLLVGAGIVERRAASSPEACTGGPG